MVLRKQLQQAQQEKDRLMSLLETAQQVLQAEQQARRELETKLLPAPRPAPAGKARLWTLAGVLLVALAGLVVILIRPELIRGLTGG